jgi:hypothetical protein
MSVAGHVADVDKLIGLCVGWSQRLAKLLSNANLRTSHESMTGARAYWHTSWTASSAGCINGWAMFACWPTIPPVSVRRRSPTEAATAMRAGIWRS